MPALTKADFKALLGGAEVTKTFGAGTEREREVTFALKGEPVEA